MIIARAIWARPRDSFYTLLWAKAAGQGITVVVASGDSGAYDCVNEDDYPTRPQAVNGIASTPNNVAVGGTQFNYSARDWNATNGAEGVSAKGYITEEAWDDLTDDIASGGGASSVYTKPTWQSCPGVPDDGWRDVPDVALDADVNVGFRIYSCGNDDSNACSDVSWGVIGGTSCGAPSFAGIMALIVQSIGRRTAG